LVKKRTERGYSKPLKREKRSYEKRGPRFWEKRNEVLRKEKRGYSDLGKERERGIWGWDIGVTLYRCGNSKACRMVECIKETRLLKKGNGVIRKEKQN